MGNWFDQDTKKAAVVSTISSVVSVSVAMLIFRNGNTSSSLSRFLTVLSPLIWGFALAYLLAPALRRLENLLSKITDRKKPRPTLKRVIALAIIYIILIVVLFSVISWLLPELVKSIMNLVDVLPGYARYLGTQLTNFLAKHDIDTQQLAQALGAGENWLDSALNYLRPLLNNVVNISMSLTSTLSNFFIGLIASIYMLAGKERFARQIKKLMYAFFPKDRVDTVIHWARQGHRTFGGFIGGKILDSAIIGIVCYLFMLVTHMPYSLILSVIVGVTNLVPFFGPLVGGVVASLIMILVDSSQAILFIPFCIILQQIDGNILGPAILGDSIGLSPFWVMAAIIVGGKLFGFVGMLVSIPVFALIYAIVRTVGNRRLAQKGMSVATDDYENFPPPDETLDGGSQVKPGYLTRLKALFKSCRRKGGKKAS